MLALLTFYSSGCLAGWHGHRTGDLRPGEPLGPAADHLPKEGGAARAALAPGHAGM